jgi:hypothetical protein
MCSLDYFSPPKGGLNPRDAARERARSHMTSGQENPTCGILHGFRLSGMLRRSNRDAIEQDVRSCQRTPEQAGAARACWLVGASAGVFPGKLRGISTMHTDTDFSKAPEVAMKRPRKARRWLQRLVPGPFT